MKTVSRFTAIFSGLFLSLFLLCPFCVGANAEIGVDDGVETGVNASADDSVRPGFTDLYFMYDDNHGSWIAGKFEQLAEGSNVYYCYSGLPSRQYYSVNPSGEYAGFGGGGRYLTGRLSSPTAKIVSVTAAYGVAGDEGYLKEDGFTYGIRYRPLQPWDHSVSKEGKYWEIEEVEGEPGSFCSEWIWSPMTSPPRGAVCYKMVIRDGGQEEEYFLIDENAKTEDKESMLWPDSPNSSSNGRVFYLDDIKLLDGKSREQVLDGSALGMERNSAYGYWPSETEYWNCWLAGRYVGGITVEKSETGQIGSIPHELDRDSITVTSDTVRVSAMRKYDRERCAMAFADGCTANFYFYQSRVYQVAVNGGGWSDMANGYMSRELPLRQGLNVIQIVSYSINKQVSAESVAYPGSYHSQVVLVYKEAEPENGPGVNGDTSLIEDGLKVYQAASSSHEARKLAYAQRLAVREVGGVPEYYITMNPQNPWVWLTVTAAEPAASVSVPGSVRSLGGYLLDLEAADGGLMGEIPIEIVASDGESRETVRVKVDWEECEPVLGSLEVAGGTLLPGFQPDGYSYSIELEEGAGQLEFRYTLSPYTKVEVSVDGAAVDPREDGDVYIFTVPSADVHGVKLKVTASDGYEGTYALSPLRSDTGVPEGTKQKAKDILAKNGTLEKFVQLMKERGETGDGQGGYWGIFQLFSIANASDTLTPGDILNGAYAYDVTGHKFNQATDYGAVILELAMIGENPYDFCGRNYVEELADKGGGAFANNIWALWGMDAAGYPKSYASVVGGQACSVTFNLDMRGWALAAMANHMDAAWRPKISASIEQLKDMQIRTAQDQGGVNVAGVFDEPEYNNRNINTQGCIISALAAHGVDVCAEEWQADDGSDPLDIFERVLEDDGTFIRVPGGKEGTGEFNKDAIIGLGDVASGQSVFSAAAVTEDKYADVLDRARAILDDTQKGTEGQRIKLEGIYQEAEPYRSEGTSVSGHGELYYKLKDQVQRIEGKEWDIFIGTSQERGQVRAVIQSISQIGTAFTYADAAKVEAAEKSYSQLQTDLMRHQVENADVLEEAAAYMDAVGAFLAAVQDVDAATGTAARAAAIQKANGVYGALTDRQKKDPEVVEALAALESGDRQETGVLSVKAAGKAIYTKGTGKSVTLTAFWDGKKLDPSQVTWSSSNVSKATVTKKGVARAVKAGKVTVTAAYNGQKASVKLTVSAPTLKLGKSRLVLYTKGQPTAVLSAVVNGSRVQGKKVTWKTSDTKIAKVSKSGKITAKKTGKVTITAKANGKTATCTVVIRKPSLKLGKKAVSVKKGKSVRLSVDAKPAAKVTYQSSDKKVASVTSKGVVKGRKKGKTTITVKANGIKKTVTVKVR